jgi:hypothetical protein
VQPWPISWRTLPYNILQFNPTPDDPMGISFPELVMPMQDDLNRVLTLILELAKRQRRVIFYDPNRLVDGEDDKLTSLSLLEFIKTNDPQSVASQIQVGGNFQELLLLKDHLKNEIRSMIGVGEMERGQRINVETAAEAQQVGAGAALQRGRNQGPFEDFLADVIETFGIGIQDTLAEPYAIPILGEEDATALFAPTPVSPSYLEVEPQQIRGDFIYKIRPGSTLPHDPDAEIRKQLALNAALMPFGEAVNQLHMIVQTVRAFEQDPSKYAIQPKPLADNMAARAQSALLGMGQQKPDQQGGGGQASDSIAKLSAAIQQSRPQGAPLQ